MNKKLFTSESVTEGHPDKVCDRISDAVLDAVMEKDPKGRVACECCCTTGQVIVMGEISTECYVDIPSIVRETLKEIGYDNPEAGFDGNTCGVMVAIDEQSPDIALGTSEEAQGAGDQGMMFGFACNETPDYMPLAITLANRMAFLLAQRRKDGALDFALPDGKTQVTVEYEDDKPVRIATVVISTQHKADYELEDMVGPLIEDVVNPALEEARAYIPGLDIYTYDLLINPTGRFVKGGPAADTGLTGRKIIVDTYGGYAPHGGGAFSGKDPTKVDRSAAYMARYIAKNIVAAGLADKCLVQLSYAIGVQEPVSVYVDTYEAEDPALIKRIVDKCFNLTPAGIINELDLRRPIYKNTSAYGHFGNTVSDDRPWERMDMVAPILLERARFNAERNLTGSIEDAIDAAE